MNLKKTIFFLFILCSLKLNAQKKCEYNIDYNKIVENKSLDYLINKINSNVFIATNNVSTIPSYIKEQLNCLTNDFSIANPKQKFQSSCIAQESLPKRKLIFLAKSNNLLVMTYVLGGFTNTVHVLLIEYNENKIVELWTGFGSNKLASTKDIIKFLNMNKNKKNFLNSKKVYF